MCTKHLFDTSFARTSCCSASKFSHVFADCTRGGRVRSTSKHRARYKAHLTVCVCVTFAAIPCDGWIYNEPTISHHNPAQMTSRINDNRATVAATWDGIGELNRWCVCVVAYNEASCLVLGFMHLLSRFTHMKFQGRVIQISYLISKNSFL